MLNNLLDKGLAYDPHYLPSYNSDHMPMALCAMASLGASDADLMDFQDRYAKNLRPVVPGPAVRSVAEGRGKADAYDGLRRLLENDIESRGIKVVVETYLPELLPSLAADAFHPLIRLGFALSEQHEGEVASALAYWMTMNFQPPMQTPIDGDLEQVFRDDTDPGIGGVRFGEGLQLLVDRGIYPTPVDCSLEACASASLSVYLGTRNFFALHLVTATQAANACRTYVDEAELVRSLTAGLRAAYQIVGAPDFDTVMPVPKQLDEAHAIKYVYACAEEHKVYKDPRYLEEIEGFKNSALMPGWFKRV